MALQRRDKVTFVMPDQIGTLGMWLEQLLAESTGKQGTGLVPVAEEALEAAEAYGNDRVFVYYRLDEDDQKTRDKAFALRDSGHPVITIRMADRYDLAQVFYRWEIAVATAGAVLGVNVFDQPNVQECKDNTREILERLRETESLPEGDPEFAEGALRVYGRTGAAHLEGALKALFESAAAGDYCALLAYVPENGATAEKIVSDLRRPLQRRLKLATTLGYGPRYLHSTGQLHKGGPDAGVYLMLTADPGDNLQVPGRSYGFGSLRLAQAVGDLQALQKHGRRVLRIHLGSRVAEGLDRVGKALGGALGQIESIS